MACSWWECRIFPAVSSAIAPPVLSRYSVFIPWANAKGLRARSKVLRIGGQSPQKRHALGGFTPREDDNDRSQGGQGRPCRSARVRTASGPRQRCEPSPCSPEVECRCHISH